MGNRPGLKFSADKVAEMQERYEGNIARQVEIINRLKEDLASAKADAAEGKGAQLIATVLLKRIGEPVVIHKNELESADPSEVTVIERHGGGILVRLEVKEGTKQ